VQSPSCLSATVGRAFLLYRAKPVSRATLTVINLSFILTLTSNYTLEFGNLQKKKRYALLCDQRDLSRKGVKTTVRRIRKNYLDSTR
ncbi:MAG: hypothetical protein OEY90_02795, partial [Candidatus Bathyarchaeota archaeon]|nr:hypothetical protein [Candidatus Bathyarchaeota archaeon]